MFIRLIGSRSAIGIALILVASSLIIAACGRAGMSTAKPDEVVETPTPASTHSAPSESASSEPEATPSTTTTAATTAATTSPATATTDFKSLANPFPPTEKSIRRGGLIFARYCTECHGPDGKALLDVVADATDLTSPRLWYSGTTEGEIFRSIRDGAGEAMPPFKGKLAGEADIWHLVNFTRNLWPAAVRPEVQTESSN